MSVKPLLKWDEPKPLNFSFQRSADEVIWPKMDHSTYLTLVSGVFFIASVHQRLLETDSSALIFLDIAAERVVSTRISLLNLMHTRHELTIEARQGLTRWQSDDQIAADNFTDSGSEISSHLSKFDQISFASILARFESFDQYYSHIHGVQSCGKGACASGFGRKRS